VASATNLRSVTTAQVLFSVALGVIAVIIVAFGVFVLTTTLWGNRWVSKKNRNQKSEIS
jgi:hypothetical protein